MFSLFELRKQPLLRLKLRPVDAAPASAQLHRMLQVQHLVIDNVFDRIARYSRMIEDATHDDRVVRRIVMRQAVARPHAAPSHLRPRQQSVKKLLIQPLENFIEVVGEAARRGDLLSSSHLPQQVRLGCHIVTGNVTTVSSGMQSLNRFAINLGQQDMSNGLKHGLRRTLQQVGDADVYHVLTQADGAVDISEGVKLHPKLRNGRPQTELTIGPLKNLLKFLAQVVSNLTRAPVTASVAG